MKHQENKYRVNDFDELESKLAALGAKQIAERSSTHYYTSQPSNDVVKLVAHSNRWEVHMLKEAEGTFTLTKKISLGSLREGLKWLQDNGYEKVAVVTMRHVDYEYGGGIVGLYVINELLHSVILDFPTGQHDEVAAALGLEDSEVIEVPYNKYLEKMGQLELTSVAALG